MPKERFKITPAVYLMLIKDNNILLMRRYNTGYEDGNYGLPSGHEEPGEYPSESILRESLEEIDVTIALEHVNFALTLIRIRNVDRECLDLFFTADKWTGEPKINEPDKCDNLQWFPLNSLPENTIPYIKHAITSFQRGDTYTEFGK